MAAIVHPNTDPTGVRPAAGRPQLRLIPGGAGRPSRAVYLRRRLVAGLAALVVAAAALALGWAALEAWAPPPSAPSAAASLSPSSSVAGTAVVVHSGDSLWSIARRLQPSGDIRALVDRLAAAHGDGPLLPGDRIPLTGIGAPPAAH